jgi:hypothetical protein
VSSHLSEITSVNSPKLDGLIIRAGHKPKTWNFSKLSDDIFMALEFSLKISLVPDPYLLVLASSDYDSIWHAKGCNSMRVTF